MRIYDCVNNMLIQKEHEIMVLISSIDEVRRELVYLVNRANANQLGHKVSDRIEKLISRFLPTCSDSTEFLQGLLLEYTDHVARIETKVALAKILKQSMGRKNASATITKLHISFISSASVYSVIELNGSELSYGNRIAPRLSPFISREKSSFETITVNLTDSQVEKLFEQISSVDYEKWESDDSLGVLEFRGAGAEYQSFHCDYNDGGFFEYETCSKPPSSFREMFEILTKYCDWSLIPLSFNDNTFN